MATIDLSPTHPPKSTGDIVRYWRNTRRLSQLDLAYTADISARHLSFIETGRSHPSREMLLRLADALQLPFQDTNILLSAANYPPLYSAFSLDDQRMSLIRHALQHTLTHHEPYPAIVVNDTYDILMMNQGFRQFVEWFDCYSTLQNYDNNLCRLVFAKDGLRPFFENWPIVESLLLKRLYLEALATQNSQIWELYTELSGDQPVTNINNLVEVHQFPVLNFTLCKDEISFSFFSMMTIFGTAVDVTLQQVRIESFFPSDEQTKALFSS